MTVTLCYDWLGRKGSNLRITGSKEIGPQCFQSSSLQNPCGKMRIEKKTAEKTAEKLCNLFLLDDFAESESSLQVIKTLSLDLQLGF